MIQVEHLSKRFGPRMAVSDVSFRCEPGTITGFLGPNGAGKSTTLRMICGLTPPSEGSATVLGADYRRIPNPGRHVGVLLDASAQHSGRTGKEVLTLGARTLGVDGARVTELLERVGLGGRDARKRVSAYSLGMRQLLGIAHALLLDPAVLILDEPANGLDPAGVHWLRTFLRRFADKGGTVLVSSHLLAEVAQTVEQILIIDRGRLVARRRLDELTDSGRTLEDVYLELTGGMS
jgi:ABC-2 type transport system ATP-binding protein